MQIHCLILVHSGHRKALQLEPLSSSTASDAAHVSTTLLVFLWELRPEDLAASPNASEASWGPDAHAEIRVFLRGL